MDAKRRCYGNVGSGELRKCNFESREEVVHAVHAAQPQLLHEIASVFCSREAQRFASGIGLASREHAAHDVGDMKMWWCCRGCREQRDEQLCERQVAMIIQPRIGVRV